MWDFERFPEVKFVFISKLGEIECYQLRHTHTHTYNTGDQIFHFPFLGFHAYKDEEDDSVVVLSTRRNICMGYNYNLSFTRWLHPVARHLMSYFMNTVAWMY